MKISKCETNMSNFHRQVVDRDSETQLVGENLNDLVRRFEG